MRRPNPTAAEVELPITDLKPHPKNPRRHPKKNLEAIIRSLEEHGQVKPIVYWVSPTGERLVIAGNATLQAAKALGWDTIWATRFEGTEEEAVAYMLADNRTTDLSFDDYEALFDILSELPSSPAGMEALEALINQRGEWVEMLDALPEVSIPKPGDSESDEEHALPRAPLVPLTLRVREKDYLDYLELKRATGVLKDEEIFEMMVGALKSAIHRQGSGSEK